MLETEHSHISNFLVSYLILFCITTAVLFSFSVLQQPPCSPLRIKFSSSGRKCYLRNLQQAKLPTLLQSSDQDPTVDTAPITDAQAFRCRHRRVVGFVGEATF